MNILPDKSRYRCICYFSEILSKQKSSPLKGLPIAYKNHSFSLYQRLYSDHMCLFVSVHNNCKRVLKLILCRLKSYIFFYLSLLFFFFSHSFKSLASLCLYCLSPGELIKRNWPISWVLIFFCLIVSMIWLCPLKTSRYSFIRKKK